MRDQHELPRRPDPMGSNDHQPVPDPKPKEKTVDNIAYLKTILSTLTVRVDQLEESLARVNLTLGHRQVVAQELRCKLLQTIEAVKRLAKGKSLGCLGLPSDEEWNPPA